MLGTWQCFTSFRCDPVSVSQLLNDSTSYRSSLVTADRPRGAALRGHSSLPHVCLDLTPLPIWLDGDAIHRLALRQVGKHILQRTEVKLPAPSAFQPGNIFGVLKTLYHLPVFLNRQNYRYGFPVARNNFRLSVRRLHKRTLSVSGLRVNLGTRFGKLSRFLFQSGAQCFVF